MKRHIFNSCTKIGIAGIALYAIFTFTTCETLRSALKEPLVSLHSVELAKINFTGAEVLCKVQVENPNAFDIPFPEVGWQFFINTNSFISGVIKNDKFLKAREKTMVDVPVRFEYLEVFNTFKSLIESKQADYKVALDFKFNFPIIGEKVWHLEHEGQFPVLHLPKLSFNGISVKNVSLTKIDFEINWEVENNNNFAMSIKDFNYNFAINNSTWSSGKVSNAPQIAANMKTIIPLAFSINGLAMIKDITEIITKRTDVSFSCGGNLNLGMALPGLSDLNTPFNFSGTTKLLR